MEEIRPPADTAYRITRVSGDMGYVVEALERGATAPTQVAAFRSHTDAETWIIMKALKVVGAQ